ncbi:MAG: SxtJ family membrane protein [Bacteroidetes bacterium]|jgi:hypothetical protein|nr:SxtJ family membrane protein [Bacteroidota bacterium]MCL5033977.1 SxtJ family membrane protein [Bacteroidota bacterium]
MMLLEEIRQIKESKKDLRKFGLTVGPVLLAIGLYLFLRGRSSGAYWAATGILLIFLSIVAPVVLKPLNKGWMILAILLGWVMTRFILVILFYLVLTPTGLIARMFRKDFLDRRFDRTRNSYWQKREKNKFDPRDYERQF